MAKQRTLDRPQKGDMVYMALVYVLAVVAFVATLYPFLYVIAVSFSDSKAVYGGEVYLFPKDVTLAGYEQVLNQPDLWLKYGNTILYTAAGTLFNIVATTLAAYPLSRTRFCARRFLNFFITFTMYFSGGMIPTFLVVKNLGLIDTVWSLVLPGLVSPWNMFIMKNYFQTSIPTELYEAASIDGADNFHLLRSVVLPLSAPIVAVMVLYYGVAHWNSYFNALLYLRDRTRYPLQLVLRSFFSANDYSEQGGAGGDSGMTALLVSETMKYALIVIASGPILCLYPLLQRFFVKGVMLGAIKG